MRKLREFNYIPEIVSGYKYHDNIHERGLLYLPSSGLLCFPESLLPWCAEYGCTQDGCCSQTSAAGTSTSCAFVGASQVFQSDDIRSFLPAKQYKACSSSMSCLPNLPLPLTRPHRERDTALSMLTASCKDVSQKHHCCGTQKPFSSIFQPFCTPAEFSSSHELLQGLSDHKHATMMPYLVMFEAFPVAGVLWATIWEYSPPSVRLAQVPSHQTQP